MRNAVLILMFLIAGFSEISFGWECVYGGDDNEKGKSVIQTDDGGYIVVGDISFSDTYTSDVYLIRTDGDGNILWSRTYGGSESDLGSRIIRASDNGYIIVGTTSSFGAGGTDVYLIKIDDEGDTLWTRTYGGGADDGGSCVIRTTDGGYVIAGVTKSFGAGASDVYLIKTDNEGDTLWTRTYGGEGFDWANSVVQSADGGYVIVGGTTSFGAGGMDVYLVKTDGDGSLLWSRTYGESDDDAGRGVVEADDGGYVITGFTNPFGSEYLHPPDIYLLKTDSDGNLLWERSHDGPGSLFDYGNSVAQTSDGGYVIAGVISYIPPEPGYAYLLKTDRNGNGLWLRAYFGYEDDSLEASSWAYSVTQTDDGGYITTGYIIYFGRYDFDAFLVKTDSLGYSEIKEFSLKKSDSLSVEISPNPFNLSCEINVNVDINAPKFIKIYDLRGNILLNRVYEKNNKIIWVPHQSVSSGVYLIKVTMGNRTVVKKAVLIR